jgi:hypothetical protein
MQGNTLSLQIAFGTVAQFFPLTYLAVVQRDFRKRDPVQFKVGQKVVNADVLRVWALKVRLFDTFLRRPKSRMKTSRAHTLDLIKAPVLARFALPQKMHASP